MPTQDKKYKYKNYENVRIVKSQYENGRPAIILCDDEGVITTATVNMPEHHLNPGEAFIKTWSENEHILPFLIGEGIVEDTGREVPTGYVNAPVCKLLI